MSAFREVGYWGAALEAMGMQDKDMEFSIVSGSNEEMLFGCLESLTKTMKSSRYAWSVTVTCNTPGTGLAGRLRARYPDIAVIDNDFPKGFAANHNRVLRLSRARYLWLLKDDLLILPDAIRLVTEFLDRPENARVGAASPRLLNPDGTLQPSTYPFPSMPQILLAHSGLRDLQLTESFLGRLAPGLRSREAASRFQGQDKTTEVDTLRGACVAMRMKAARQVGPMVEVALPGSEEMEWHRRFHEEGWKVVYYPEASVIHYGSATLRDGSRNLYPEQLKSALYFFRMGHAPATYLVFSASLLAMFGARAALAWMTRDRNAAQVARRYVGVAWDGILRR